MDYIYTVSPKKHVFSTITLTISVRLQQCLAQLVVSLCVIERWFHFPPQQKCFIHNCWQNFTVSQYWQTYKCKLFYIFVCYSVTVH